MDNRDRGIHLIVIDRRCVAIASPLAGPVTPRRRARGPTLQTCRVGSRIARTSSSPMPVHPRLTVLVFVFACADNNPADTDVGSTSAPGSADDTSPTGVDTGIDVSSGATQTPTDATSNDAESEGGEVETGGDLPGLAVGFELATPEQIAIHAVVEGTIDADARVTGSLPSHRRRHVG